MKKNLRVLSARLLRETNMAIQEVDESQLDASLTEAGLCKRTLTDEELSRTSNVKSAVPLVIEPLSEGSVGPEELVSYLRTNRTLLRDTLTQYGAILLRGFGLNDSEIFSHVSAALSDQLESEYLSGATPRPRVDGKTNVFVSTKVSAATPIMPHTEMAYLRHRPQIIFFQCSLPAEKFGETPIFDCRKAYQSLSNGLQEELKRREFLYIRRFPMEREGLMPKHMRTWQEAFEAETKEEAEAKCGEVGISAEWKGPKEDYLLTESTVPCIVDHPKTGQPVINLHIMNKHMWELEIENLASQLNPQKSALLLERVHKGFDIGWMPFDTVWGDTGEPLSNETTKELHTALWNHSVVFSWHRGDVLLVDNFSMGHSRMNYEGDRLVLTTLGETITV